MGRVAVRQVVAAYLENLNLLHVGTVFPARPLIVTEEDYDLTMAGFITTSSNGSSAVLVVNIPDSKRTVEALTGRAGLEDKDIHSVVLELFLANTAGDAMGAQADHDAIVDAINAGVRGDPTLGAPSVVFSAGEFDAGIQVTQREPFTTLDGTTIVMPALIEFDVWEWIEGTPGSA